MKRYRVGLYEEIAGYIVVEAENQEKAEEIGGLYCWIHRTRDGLKAIIRTDYEEL